MQKQNFVHILQIFWFWVVANLYSIKGSFNVPIRLKKLPVSFLFAGQNSLSFLHHDCTNVLSLFFAWLTQFGSGKNAQKITIFFSINIWQLLLLFSEMSLSVVFFSNQAEPFLSLYPSLCSCLPPAAAEAAAAAVRLSDL